MCSRYSLTSPPEAIRNMFGFRNKEDFPPRYNIAPTQPAGIVRATSDGEREFRLVRWGLIPSWVKDPREFTTLINARSETAADKPSFRGPMRHRRCLVPADAFYEWTGKPGSKIPHLIRSSSHAPMALAGVWDHWLGADGSEIETMAILTTSANAEMRTLHDRMPVVLSERDFGRWLDCKPGTADFVLDLLRPASDGALEIVQVSQKLNNARNEGPELQEAVRATLF